jgi:hypothetical protein
VAEFRTTGPDADGMWHTVCVDNPDAFGEASTPQDAYELARFALDSLTPQSAEALSHALLHNEHATRPNQHDEAVAAGEIDCPRQSTEETDHA